MTRDKSIYPLNGISLPRIPPSCWRQIAQSSTSSSRACSCSWQFRLLPQASRRSSAAATSSFSPLFPPSMPGCCCDVCCDSHWVVRDFRSVCILNMDARTCWENTRIWETSWMLDTWISDSFFVLKRNSRISPYIAHCTLLSRRAWYPPALGISCPALMLAPPILTILPLRGSMKDSASMTPPTGTTAPARWTQTLWEHFTWRAAYA